MNYNDLFIDCEWMNMNDNRLLQWVMTTYNGFIIMDYNGFITMDYNGWEWITTDSNRSLWMNQGFPDP